MIKMKRALVVLSMLIVSSSLAGCIEENGKSITYYSDYDCDISWHIEFFDLSSNDFGEWEGTVEFTGSDGTTEKMEQFSSEKKYVLLDNSISWTLEYTFYEDDIGFIIDDVVYGGDNQYGDSGTLDVALIIQTKQMSQDDNDQTGSVSFASCEPNEYHVEFFDMSSFDFCCWDGEVEFTTDSGEKTSIADFSSGSKYVTLEQGYVWTMDYTFYEEDIGFIVDGVNYGGDNEEGDSGSIIIDLS